MRGLIYNVWPRRVFRGCLEGWRGARRDFWRDAVGLVVALVVVAGCGSSGTRNEELGPDPTEGRDETEGRRAPWGQDPLAASEVPDVYLEAWREAENRATCALIAPDTLGRGADAEARRAQFGGGWGVAYDVPQLRSAFGVAGTGVSDTTGTYDEWPYSKRWSDGSYAGYGPEGGGRQDGGGPAAGENQLAYLWIEGQECLYNVWSRLGVDHLELLLEHLRFVEAAG